MCFTLNKTIILKLLWFDLRINNKSGPDRNYEQLYVAHNTSICRCVFSHAVEGLISQHIQQEQGTTGCAVEKQVSRRYLEY